MQEQRAGRAIDRAATYNVQNRLDQFGLGGALFARDVCIICGDAHVSANVRNGWELHCSDGCARLVKDWSHTVRQGEQNFGAGRQDGPTRPVQGPEIVYATSRNAWPHGHRGACRVSGMWRGEFSLFTAEPALIDRP